MKPLLQMHSLAGIALQETKLDSKIALSELNVPNYRLFRKDRNRNGGGVALYLHESLNPHRLKIRSAVTMEIIAAEISFARSKAVIASVYSPNKENGETFVNDFGEFLAEIDADNSSVLVFGDTNRDYLSDEFDIFEPVLNQFTMRQLIEEPTHNARCIDQIFASFSVFAANRGTASPIEKIHAVTWVQVTAASIRKQEPCHITSWKWDDIDLPRLHRILRYDSNFEDRDLSMEIEDCPDVNTACDYLTAVLYEAQRETVPHTQVRFRKQPCPWMDKPLLRALQRRDRAFGEFKHNKSTAALNKWKKLKRKARYLCRVAKKELVSNCFSQFNTVGEFWKIVRRLQGQKELKTSLLFDGDGRVLLSKKDCAESLSANFKQNWNMCDQEEEHVFDNAFLEHSWYCSADDVEEFIAKIDSAAAIGFDGLSPKFLKACSADIAPSVAVILNKCLLEGEFPEAWKNSRIVAVPKSSDAETVTQMRPISILPVLSKIGELWLKSISKPFLMDRAHSHQFAYLPGRSTEDAIAMVQYFVTSGFRACAKATRVAAVSIDISKAFDTVPKRSLIQTLRVRNCLPDGIARLLHSYVHNRKQTVQYSGELSSTAEVIS
ncbi:MAG: hypothetical protein GY696_37840 [Gammaproteobacteria bacterium]|nr:hypothetical protein [Gammaproteobacteria bacterium]